VEVLESGFQLGMTCPQPHQMDRSAVIGGLFFGLFGLVVLPLHTVYSAVLEFTFWRYSNLY
jgi:hypothetical protein